MIEDESGEFWTPGTSRSNKERARSVLKEAQAIIDKAEEDGRELTDREAKRFDRLMDEHATLTEDLEMAQDNQDRSGPYDVRVTADHTVREKLGRFVTGEITADELRAGTQSVGTGSEGGITVPTEVSSEIFRVVTAFDGIRRTRAQRFETDHGRDITVPGIDDTANQASIVSEGSTTTGGSTNLVFTSETLEATMYQAGPIVISYELVQDSASDIVDVVRDKLGERMGRATASHFATRSSTESSGPHGLVNASSGAVTVTQGSSNLTWDNLRNLYFSVDPRWRERGEWAMSDEAMQATMGLKDGNDQPIVNPDVKMGEPQRLLGKPIRVVTDLPDLSASGNQPIFFGDFTGFAIRDVRQVEIQVLRERFSLERQIGVVAWSRHDSRPLYSTSTGDVPAGNRPLRCIVMTT